ncbi:unnamed protein product [Caenorhabditis bovis]|uniref:Membralin n=1 Tax=Caenorhabditis bovis TaxID=2654633 RepID=A0A8S1FF77_9PELO|nr:unnamed protein product [Caenorhabditis bovis]
MNVATGMPEIVQLQEVIDSMDDGGRRPEAAPPPPPPPPPPTPPRAQPQQPPQAGQNNANNNPNNTNNNNNINRNNRGNGQNGNQFGTVRDRLFYAMLVRIAIRYNSRFNLNVRRAIEAFSLCVSLLLLSALLFIHLRFTRTTSTCLSAIKPNWIREGVIRVEVVHNLHMLEKQEDFVKTYVNRQSRKFCYFNPADVFRQGPVFHDIRRTIAERDLKAVEQVNDKSASDKGRGHSMWFFRSPFDYFHVPASSSRKDLMETVENPYEREALTAWDQHFKRHHPNENEDYRYLYRVEYAYLYGVLRLPPAYRDKHGIRTYWIRIDSKNECFGDGITRYLMQTIGYEDAIVSSLRAQALNFSINGDTNSMGYLHDLDTHEHYHFVANVLGKSSYFTAAILMFVFTFAISMLLRFSHHQIFMFIIDLLHMFELQQPLHFPVAPIFTVILALVGMEAIMSEVFNDTTTAFYVILIVWIADQFDAICCHSPISKRMWLRFFYIYQYFFYAYQYRFGGQYGNLALWTSASFILHSMIYFFHHFEMPLILYQDRVQQVLADIDAPRNAMGTVEVQTITVAVHSRQNPQEAQTPPPPPPTRQPPMAQPRVIPEASQQRQGPLPPGRHITVLNQDVDAIIESIPIEDYDEERNEILRRQQMSPSSVFDARGPVSPPQIPAEPAPTEERRGLTLVEEVIAQRIIDQTLDELFNSSE